jgi:hypothetical protein
LSEQVPARGPVGRDLKSLLHEVGRGRVVAALRQHPGISRATIGDHVAGRMKRLGQDEEISGGHQAARLAGGVCRKSCRKASRLVGPENQGCDDRAGFLRTDLRYCSPVRSDTLVPGFDKAPAAQHGNYKFRLPVARRRRATTARCKYLTKLYFPLAEPVFSPGDLSCLNRY